MALATRPFFEQAEELKRYVREADDLMVLINLRDVIVHGARDKRVQEAAWITKAILDVAHSEGKGRKPPRAAIVLSQADIYEATIKECGGAKGALKKYLPHVYNSYSWLDAFAAYTVDKTRLDDDGAVVPDPAFTTEGLRPIMDWLLDMSVGGRKCVLIVVLILIWLIASACSVLIFNLLIG